MEAGWVSACFIPFLQIWYIIQYKHVATGNNNNLKKVSIVAGYMCDISSRYVTGMLILTFYGLIM